MVTVDPSSWQPILAAIHDGVNRLKLPGCKGRVHDGRHSALFAFRPGSARNY
jgi:hypothetical protein